MYAIKHEAIILSGHAIPALLRRPYLLELYPVRIYR